MRDAFGQGFEVVFAQNGLDIRNPKTKSVKLDISKFVLKYDTGGMKDKERMLFEERTFLELLEEVAFKLKTNTQYQVMYTCSGQAIRGIEELKKYLLARRASEITDLFQRPFHNRTSRAGSNTSIINSNSKTNEKTEGTIEDHTNETKKNKARFVNFSSDQKQSLRPLSMDLEDNEPLPPLLLVSCKD